MALSPVIIAAGNPHDIAIEDLQDLATQVATVTGLEVEVRQTKEYGAGVTLWEVLRVWLPDQQLIEGALYASLVTVLTSWFKARFKKPHGRQRKKSVTIYGPDGSPLRHITIAEEVAEPSDEVAGDGDLPHDPPE